MLLLLGCVGCLHFFPQACCMMLHLTSGNLLQAVFVLCALLTGLCCACALCYDVIHLNTAIAGSLYGGCSPAAPLAYLLQWFGTHITAPGYSTACVVVLVLIMLLNSVYTLCSGTGPFAMGLFLWVMRIVRSVHRSPVVSACHWQWPSRQCLNDTSTLCPAGSSRWLRAALSCVHALLSFSQLCWFCLQKRLVSQQLTGSVCRGLRSAGLDAALGETATGGR